MWKDFTIGRSPIRLCSPSHILCVLEATENADRLELLNLDDEQYRQLPDTISDLSLCRLKAILRQYMAVTRHMHYLPFPL